MVRESVAILVIGVLLLVVFVRSRHYGYLVASLPVLFIPAGHLIITGVLYATTGRFFGIRPQVVTAFTDLLSLVVGCAFVVFVAQRMQARRNRTLYMAVMLTYTILLGWAYIFNGLQVLFV